jgi:hypothetical protein
MFVRDYFSPPADVRFAAEGDLFVRARTYPLGQTVDWLRQAGLVLERLVEPAPLPIPTLSRAQRLRQVPYDSPAWRRLYPQLAKVPVVAVFLARRPQAGGPALSGAGPGPGR